MLMILKSYNYFTASLETDTIKKQYTKILDAYGCLGVLSLNIGGKSYLYIFSQSPRSDLPLILKRRSLPPRSDVHVSEFLIYYIFLRIVLSAAYIYQFKFFLIDKTMLMNK
jgi:hypothetical protein